MINPIEKKFQKLDEIEHCLKRPGMWVGSTKNADESTYFLNEEKQFEFRSANLNPGFLKIFDEIVSNSADEHRRNPKLNIIDVTVDQTSGKILIRDNGGIPVVMHKEHDQWVPELIFSNLRAGSNFDDTESRLVAGTNGVGSTLTNIFSTLFFVQTCDGKNAFSQKFTSNMRQKEEAKVVPAKDSRGYTNILYVPDFTQFGMTRIDDDHMNAMKKRCADVAACNPKLRVSFNGQTFKFESFEAYCKLYVPDIISESSERWRISVGPSNGAMQHVSFVNGVYTKDGGTHVDFITNQIVESVRLRLKKKHKIELKPSEIKNHMFVFVSADIVNSSFSSQTKEKLITDPRDFGSKHELSEKFMKAVCSSEMIQLILDWAQQKNAADEKKALRDLNKKIDREKVLKLIEAKSLSRGTCSLSLYEGDCLEENTDVVVFRENEGKIDVKIKDIIIGDSVITHNNRLREVIAKSSKISKISYIKTKLGDIEASSNHRFYVYDKILNDFIFVETCNLNKARHKLIKNKLNTVSLFMKILKIEKTDKGYNLHTNDNDLIISSNDHKFSVFSISTTSFSMKKSNEIDIDDDFLIFNKNSF